MAVLATALVGCQRDQNGASVQSTAVERPTHTRVEATDQKVSFPHSFEAQVDTVSKDGTRPLHPRTVYVSGPSLRLDDVNSDSITLFDLAGSVRHVNLGTRAVSADAQPWAREQLALLTLAARSGAPCEKSRTCRRVGTDPVNGRPATKWEIHGTRSTTTVWIDDVLRYPIQTVADGRTIVVREVREGPVPADIFAVDVQIPSSSRPARTRCAQFYRNERKVLLHRETKPTRWRFAPSDIDGRPRLGEAEENEYERRSAADVNGDGHDDALLRERAGCSGAGVCVFELYVSCGDDTYQLVWGPRYATEVRLQSTSSRRGDITWRDLGVTTRESSNGGAGCTVEETATVRMGAERYEIDQGSVMRQRRCARGAARVEE